MLFEDLGLSPDILAGVKAQGYTTPTPIQAQAIPEVMKGRDILGGAQTGTGKTAAFTLPILHHLSTQDHPGDHRPRVLVLAPTRELAAQVADSVETYGQGAFVRSAVIFGGVGIHPQIKQLKKGVDIVIGTPGRLLDLAGRNALDLSKLEVLVLDEADRMLDMGFIHDIRRIIKLVPRKRQTLFFSATYSKEIRALADTILHKPKLIEVARQNTAAETVDQSVYYTEKGQKRQLLSHLISDGDWSQVLVFTKTKHGANRLATQLHKDGIQSAAIHGNKSQGARTRALADFKSGQVRVLVATDIAARGLDIERLPHVVNYELPHVAEDYVHRIGRTGRAGCTGEALSLVSVDEMKLLASIERLIKLDIPVKRVEGMTTTKPKGHSRDESNRASSSGNGKSSSGQNKRRSKSRNGESRSNVWGKRKRPSRQKRRQTASSGGR